MVEKKEASRSANLILASSSEQANYNILVQIEQELKADFESKQVYSTQLARSYERLSLNSSDPKIREFYALKYMKVNFCGSYLDFAIGGLHENGFDTFDKPKLYKANFCKDRFCPLCNARRSMKLTSQLLQVMEVLQDDYVFAFLTLTIPNVSSEMLCEALQELQDAWTRFSRYVKFKKVVRGFVKTLEVTQTNSDGSFHPHYHIILALDKGYFTSRDYLRQEQWQELWCKATGKNIQAVDIRKIRPKNEKSNAIVSAVCEVAKYMVKPSDYLRGDDTIAMSNKTDYIVATLNNALNQVKLLSYGGCFLDARAKLKQDDTENGNLTMSEKDTLSKYYALLLEHYQRRPQQIAYERIDETWRVIYDETE